MKLSVIGAGYVGLTTAACLAQIGHNVFCSESDLDKLDKCKKASCRFLSQALMMSSRIRGLPGDCLLGSPKKGLDEEMQFSSAALTVASNMLIRVTRLR
jgi:hypothetical protein